MRRNLFTLGKKNWGFQLICFFTFSIFSFDGFTQCNPFLTISGNSCVGSTLTASTNIYPGTIVWKRNGTTTVATQSLIAAGGITIAGGINGGNGANQLRNPNRIFIDAAGSLYIPDMGNSRIQKWAPNATAGVTVAGGNGAGSAANQFNRVTSVYVTPNGDVYATDQENGRIQKWIPGAMAGVTVASSLSYPTAVFFDANGNMYVSEQNASRVTRWAPGASSGTTVAGGNGYGSLANQLSTPTGIFVDAGGNLYICDTDNNRVQKWAPGAASGTTIAGGNYGSAPNQLANPLGVYVDAGGNVYITDYNNYRVQKWAPGASAGVTVAGGNYGSGSNQFNQPAGISMDVNCNLYVSDFFNNRIQKFSSSDSNRIVALQPGDYTATITTPSGSVFVSNTITVQATAAIQFTIAADNSTICPGGSVTFQATAINGGQAPIFQWKKNGANVGTNLDTYTDNSLVQGDVISCVLTGNAACLSQQTLPSNSIVIQVRNPHKPVSLGPDRQICEGDSAVLDAGNFYTMYAWQDGSHKPTLTVGQAGTYFVNTQDACGASVDSVIVEVHQKPKSFLPKEVIVCKNELITLNTIVPYATYMWSNGSSSPSIAVALPGLYWVKVTDQNNCAGADSTLVTHKQCNNKLFVPSAFTPNADGKNDRLRPVFDGNVKKFKFVVYNRWGQAVFTSTDVNKMWDGEGTGHQQTSVFVWMCSYQFNGEEEKIEKGTITVIR